MYCHHVRPTCSVFITERCDSFACTIKRSLCLNACHGGLGKGGPKTVGCANLNQCLHSAQLLTIQTRSEQIQLFFPPQYCLVVVEGAACSVVVKLMDLDPQGRWFDPWWGQDKICPAVGPLSKAPHCSRGYVSCLV